MQILKNDVPYDFPCLAVLLNGSVLASVEKISQKEETKSKVNMAGDLDSDTHRDLGTWSRWNKKKGKKKKDYSWGGGSGGYSKYKYKGGSKGGGGGGHWWW